MKKRKKLSLKQAYYRTFAGLIVLPLLIVLAVSLLILEKNIKNRQWKHRECAETVAAGLLSDADFMSVHAPVTDYQCEQQHDNAVCGGSGQRQ